MIALQGPLQAWVSYHCTYQERFKHLTAKGMLQNYALFSSLYLLHLSLEFLGWMTIGTIGKMCLLEVF